MRWNRSTAYFSFFLNNQDFEDCVKGNIETYVMFCNIYLISCDFHEDEGRWPTKHVKFVLNSSDYSLVSQIKLKLVWFDYFSDLKTKSWFGLVFILKN